MDLKILGSELALKQPLSAGCTFWGSQCLDSRNVDTQQILVVGKQARPNNGDSSG